MMHTFFSSGISDLESRPFECQPLTWPTELPHHATRVVRFSVMRSLGGFVLLAGIGVGLFVYLPTPVHHTASLENAQQLWAQANQSREPSPIPAASRSFSPTISLANVTPTVPGRAERPASSTVSGAHAAVTAPAPTRAAGTTVMGWQPVVATTDVTIKSGSGAASLKPKTPTSRYKLVVEIQRKLKKRRCYRGRIDGSWGAGSKYAMQAFVDRVNATLPIKEPDYVLLTLLQANSDKTCGACPGGQTATVGGSCVPQAIVADTQRKPGSGGENVAEVLPWQRAGRQQPAAQPLLRPVGTTIVATAPLPGRMAIGGPQQLPPPSTENDNQPSNVAAITIDGSNDTDVSQPSITGTREARRARTTRGARAARRKAKRPRQRYGGVRAARRRNLMLGLGGAY